MSRPCTAWATGRLALEVTRVAEKPSFAAFSSRLCLSARMSVRGCRLRSRRAELLPHTAFDPILAPSPTVIGPSTFAPRR